MGMILLEVRVCQVFVLRCMKGLTVLGERGVPGWLYVGFYSKSLNTLVFGQNTKY